MVDKISQRSYCECLSRDDGHSIQRGDVIIRHRDILTFLTGFCCVKRAWGVGRCTMASSMFQRDLWENTHIGNTSDILTYSLTRVISDVLSVVEHNSQSCGRTVLWKAIDFTHNYFIVSSPDPYWSFYLLLKLSRKTEEKSKHVSYWPLSVVVSPLIQAQGLWKITKRTCSTVRMTIN